MKLFIGLLLIAAGAGVFFFLRSRKPAVSNNIQKELILGKWKLDSINVNENDSNGQFAAFIIAMDSNSFRYHYNVKKDGNILVSLADSVKTDTSSYEWLNNNELAWKENSKDSASEMFTITKLTMDSLLLRSKDSATFVFVKVK